MLASDGERDQTVLRLRAALVAGRIDEQEFEARVTRAHAARTKTELEALEEDLPAGAPVPATATSVPRLPGRRHFEVRKLVDGTTSEVRERLLVTLAKHTFTLHREHEGALELVSRRELGSRITVRLHEAPGGTLLHAHGRAPLAARRAVSALTL